MLKKPITYTDYNGKEVTEDFYFNLTKAELIELEMGHPGGLSEALKRIVASEDGTAIVTEFKSIILKAYGQRSDDGRRFIKTKELREEFLSSEAYSQLFFSLVTDAGAASEFVEGIMPQELMNQAQLTMNAEEKSPDGGLSPMTEPGQGFEPPVEAKIITEADMRAMDAAELAAGLASGALKFAPEMH